MKPEGLGAPLRIKKRREFLRAQGKGDKHHVRHFLVFVVSRRRPPGVRDVAPDGPPRPTRLGITVTKKVGKAHERNRIKRLVREVFRRHRAALGPGLDVVFVAKRNAATVEYADVAREFTQLVKRLGSARYGAARGAEERGC